jgi:NADH-quinone oxidoreductase subunit A
MTLPLFALAQVTDEPRLTWAPVLLLIIIGLGFAVGNVIISTLIGPSRTGPGKDTVYESGMMPVGDTRQRFNVRFYIVAMIFLVFDVEIVFFYPWATLFGPAVQSNYSQYGPLLLGEMLVFVAILLVAYFYAWGKGVFRWD